MRKNSIITLLLAAMLLPTLTSCGDSGDTAEDTTPAETAPAETAKETTEEEYRHSISDGIEDEDFGGRDFIVLGSDEQAFGDFIVVEELNGEVLNDSVYNRNLAIEERFNTKVGYTAPTGGYDQSNAVLKKAVQGGDADAFQMASYHVVSNSGNAIQGYYMNWYDVPHINFDQPWWSDSTVDDLTVNGRCYLAVGDAAVSSIAQTYCMIYDKTKILDYEIDDVYETVRDGKWTIDHLQSISADVYQDLDGNGEVDLNDYYGFISNSQSNLNTYLWSFDNQIYQKDASGELQYTYYSERLVDIFEKLYSVFYESEGITLTSYTDADTHFLAIRAFAEGHSLFVNALLSQTITFLSEFENEYGILPYPKYNEEQAEYKTMVDGNHEAMGIAKNGNDLNFVGKITEVMCAEAYKKILPAYYDVSLKQRYASSPDDAEMIELCVASRVFDFGYAYDNFSGVSFYIQNLIGRDASTDIASHYQKNEKAALTHYEKVLDVFYAEEE
ncbi:MAG: hypothetical protein IJ480_09310 [Clostridia bacterium]|nr:hypothetical protein [Clostridia bacterium]